MTVLYLSNCPSSLRGDLTKWFMEIATGVYVGRVSARVRDKLWTRVVEACAAGRAVLVFSTNNEQHMDFRVHGETWEPIDFDGLKLMLRPSPGRLAANQAKHSNSKKMGFSNAARYQKAKAYAGARKKVDCVISQRTVEAIEPFLCKLETYVVVDLETTGLKPSNAEIIEVGAVKVEGNHVTDVYQSFVRIANPVPPAIVGMTGITDDVLNEQGKPLNMALDGLRCFLGDMPIVMHNAPFDMSFLDIAFDKCGFSRLDNLVEDTLGMARKLFGGLESYKLQALVMSLELDTTQLKLGGYEVHRSLGDCHLTHMLYQKLRNYEKSGV